jgi:hypothetical protein
LLPAAGSGQTEEQRLWPAFEASTEIAYGVVIKGARRGRLADSG